MKKIVIVVVVIAAVVVLGAMALGLIGAVATPGLLRARQQGNEASAIASLRVIVSAQAVYTAVCGNGFYAPTLHDLGAAAPGSTEAILSADLSKADTVTKSGYVVTMGSTTGAVASAPAACGLPAGQMVAGYYATATPVSPEMGSRAFAVNRDGTIWTAVQQTPIRITDTGQPTGAIELK